MISIESLGNMEILFRHLGGCVAKGSLTKGCSTLIDAVWFKTDREVIGVVISFKKGFKELSSFIGRGKGFNEAEDALHIMEWGAPFPLDAAMALFGTELNEKTFVTESEMSECYIQLMKKLETQVSYQICGRLVKVKRLENKEGICHLQKEALTA
jgi:hypothetical protein